MESSLLCVDNILYISFNFKDVVLKKFTSFSSFLIIFPFFFPFINLAFDKNLEFEFFNFSFSLLIK